MNCKFQRFRLPVAGVLAPLIVLAGCSGPNRTTKTTLLGTGVGAGVGAIAGGSKGTAIGAGTGALSGFLLGRYEDKREDRLRREAYGREVNPVRYREIDSMSDQEYADFMRWRAENEADYDAYLRWKAERDRIEP